MLEITIDNCYKYDIETTSDQNNNQYFWINRKDLEIESKRNWQAIFDKYKDSSRQKYRKELTPNTTFQPDKIFVRNDFFEKIIKSYKATNLGFLELKERLGLCLYDEQKFISTSEEIFIQPDIDNNQLKEENEQLKKENEQLRKENEQLRKNNVVKAATIKESIEKPTEIQSPQEHKNMTDNDPNWFDGNKFKNFLAIIDSNKFNYKNKIGEFKYIDIKNLVNNIRNNKISEISAKKGLDKLNKIKNAGVIKYKKCTPKQKELLNLFNNLLDTILIDKTLKSKSQKDNTLMPSKDQNKKKKEKEKI